MFGYESVHNQSLGKMEMLEAIDKYIKDSISKDIAFLKEVQKLKKNKKSEQNMSSGKALDMKTKNSKDPLRIVKR